jgi:hypothetical protein
MCTLDRESKFKAVPADNGGVALRRGRRVGQGDRDQSTLMFAARMTLAHFSVVSARSLA